MFRSGTSNIVLTEPNKRSFPTEFQSKSRLSYYGSLFNSLEVNSTFYKLPMPSTIEKWATDVPKTFQFSFKLWKGITHVKDICFLSADLVNFIHTIDAAGTKKGCLLIQLPPGSGEKDTPQLERLLEEIAAADPGRNWKIAVEFRHRSWYTEQVYSLLDDHHASLVLHDMPVSGTHRLNEKAPFVYLRFHGPKGDYKGSYSEPFLYDHAQQIRQWLSEEKEVYAYFNNTAEGDAPKDLMILNKFVASLS